MLFIPLRFDLSQLTRIDLCLRSETPIRGTQLHNLIQLNLRAQFNTLPRAHLHFIQWPSFLFPHLCKYFHRSSKKGQIYSHVSPKYWTQTKVDTSLLVTYSDNFGENFCLRKIDRLFFQLLIIKFKWSSHVKR